MIAKEPRSQNQIGRENPVHSLAFETRSLQVSRYAQHLIKFSLICFSLFATFSISATQISLAFGFLGWIIYLSSTPKEKRNRIIIGPIGWAYFFFLGTGLLSVIFAKEKLLALDSFRSFWVVFTFFFAANWIKDRRDLNLYLIIIIGVASLSALVGLIQYFGGLRIPNHEFIYDKYRATGFLRGSMTFAGITLVTALISLTVFFPRRLNFPGLLWIIPLVLLALTIFLSEQRGAGFGFIGGLIFIGILKGRKILAFILIGLLLGAGIIHQSNPHLWARWKTGFNLVQDTSAERRIVLWKTALKIAQEHPLTGIGVGQFEDSARAIILPTITNPNQKITLCHAHSNPLQILATMGLLGFLAYIYFWLITFREGFRILKRAPPQSPFIIGVLSALVGFHLEGFFEYNFGDSEIITLLWFLLGGMVAISKWEAKNEKSEAKD